MWKPQCPSLGMVYRSRGCIRRSSRKSICGASSESPTEYRRSDSRTSPDGETAWSTGGASGPTKSTSVGMGGSEEDGRG